MPRSPHPQTSILRTTAILITGLGAGALLLVTFAMMGSTWEEIPA